MGVAVGLVVLVVVVGTRVVVEEERMVVEEIRVVIEDVLVVTEEVPEEDARDVVEVVRVVDPVVTELPPSAAWKSAIVSWKAPKWLIRRAMVTPFTVIMFVVPTVLWA